MRYLKSMAAVLLAAGFMSAQAAMTTPTIGVGGASGALYDNNYHLGYGVAGSVGSSNGMSDVAIKADYLNYQSESGYGNGSLNEGGVGLTALVGPNTVYLQPKVGGHVGYTRFESTNYLDVGPDISATLKLTPMVGIQAAVTPTWLINDNGNDYRTRASLGLQWTPGV